MTMGRNYTPKENRTWGVFLEKKLRTMKRTGKGDIDWMQEKINRHNGAMKAAKTRKTMISREKRHVGAEHSVLGGSGAFDSNLW